MRCSLLAASAAPAAADFRLCNNTASRVGVAVGYKDADGWTTEGWWNLPARTCETVLKGNLVARYYYVYAIDYDRGGEWMGQAFMCTRDKEFTIRGISDCLARGYDRTGFFEVDTGEQRAWTVQLTKSSEQAPQRPLPAGNPAPATPPPRTLRLPAPVRRPMPRPEARADEAAAAHQSRRDAWAGLFEPRHHQPAVRGRRRRISHQYEPYQPRQDARTRGDHPRGRSRMGSADRHPGRSAGTEAAARQLQERLRRRSTAGQDFMLDTDPAPGDATRVHLPHPEIFAAIKPGDTLLIDDGKLRLQSRREVEPQRIVARVEVGGKISSRKGVSLPDTVVPVAALAAKDIADLEAALDAGIDWVALSFIQRPEDIAEAKKITRGRAAVMAKIEKPQAVSRLDDILDLADALMVARGDLGVEMPLEKVPGVQKEMTRACRRAGKPVIVATQMLESMITSPVPTRAEVSDVATAIFDGADAVMLSAESAAGQYPVEAVATMNRIAEEVENEAMYLPSLHVLHTEPEATGADAIAAAARQVAETLDLAAIVCWTSLGLDRDAGLARAAEAADRRHFADGRHRAEIVAGLGHPLRRCRGRARSGRHGRARLPDRFQRRLRQGRPARHHRRRRAARHAGRHQHDPRRFRRRRRAADEA